MKEIGSLGVCCCILRVGGGDGELLRGSERVRERLEGGFGCGGGGGVGSLIWEFWWWGMWWWCVGVGVLIE